MKTFTVLISTDLLADFLVSYDCEDSAIESVSRHFRNLEEVTPRDIWTLAICTLDAMAVENVQRLEDNYDCSAFDGEQNFLIRWSDEIIGHVADEIIENCCKTVLDY